MSVERSGQQLHPTDTGMNKPVRVAILLCTFNGASFLKQQINSFVEQTHKNWTLYVSDDGSTDGTLELLEQYRRDIGEDRIKIIAGPQQGFAKNFLSLAQFAQDSADYYAFSDQDDIWHPEKLDRGINQLLPLGSPTPSIYCSRTRLIDSEGKVIGFSPLFQRPPSFENALVQSIAGANTMLINGPALALLNSTPSQLNIVAHDWLAYLLITSCGGTIRYDLVPTLDYRQHAANIIGANAGILTRITRLTKMLKGRSRNWSESNLAILEHFRPHMPEQNVRTLNRFIHARRGNLLQRMLLLWRPGIYRQTTPGNCSLVIALALNKI